MKQTITNAIQFIFSIIGIVLLTMIYTMYCGYVLLYYFFNKKKLRGDDL